MANSKNLMQAAAGAAAGGAVYVEDVFSTYLYTSTGSALTITNGLDLSGEGGLVWIKDRDAAINHVLIDTERGKDAQLYINTSGQITPGNRITAFNSNGFTLGTDSDVNTSSARDYCSWSFRKQAGFFDVVTYTGNSNTNQTVSHNLGSAPGMIIVKRTDSTSNWTVYHRSIGSNYIYLNSTNAQVSSSDWQDITSSSFRAFDAINVSGASYVAYLFAHDDQSFGDDSDEAIIKCGSYTGNGSADGPEVNLGFEPQFLLVRNAGGANWVIADTMRSFGVEDMASLYPNATNAESTIIAGKGITPTATGFKCIDSNGTTNQNNETHIYVAIRRPMKTPEAGTEIYSPVAYSGNSTAARSITCGFPLDWVVTQGRNAAIEPLSYTRLQSSGKKLATYSYSAEGSSGTNVITSFDQDGMTVGTDTDINNSSYTYINWFFKRAPKAFDIVGYTGDGVLGRTISHGLGVAPELLIIKQRNSAGENWTIWNKTIAAANAANYLALDTDAAVNNAAPSRFNSTAPTASVFTVSSDGSTNKSGGTYTYLALMWATLAGVTKVGTYSGTGSDVNVDCGFSSTARFILLKRTDSTGDWYVYDSARGIVAGNDPYQEWNNAGSETTGTDYIDPYSSGFTVTSSAPADLNASGGTYIFLAIA